MRVHYLQHADAEGPGGVEAWAAARGHALAGTRPDRGEPLPPPGEVDLLAVLGGGMSVHDDLPWLADEKRFITEVIGKGIPVLGICLGSQLVAVALGGTVAAMPEPEIGWFVVEWEGGAAPGPTEVFHWHGETWSLPPGAVRLAGSAACANQAFAWGERVVGVQFHPEMTEAIARTMLSLEALPRGRFVQDAGAILAHPRRFEAMRPLLFALLDRLAARVP